MKKIITGIIVGLTVSAIAYVTIDFPGWHALIQNTPDIIVARCVATPDLNPTDKNGVELNMRGLISANMEIVSVLKGSLNSGTTSLKSSYRPFQNEYYLIFAHHDDGFCQAFEKYRIIPLGEYFSTNSIAGKPLDEQIQILFQQRLNQLNRQMKSEQEEKQLLEEGLKQ